MVHQSDFLQERAASEALAGNKEVTKVLRRIEKAEAKKVCYKLLRNYLKPSTRGGFTRIEVANDDGTTRTVTEPREGFNLILKGIALTSAKLLELHSQHHAVGPY